MVAIRSKLKYLSVVILFIIVGAITYKIGKIIDPRDNLLEIFNKIISYNLINGEKFKLTISQLLISLSTLTFGVWISNHVTKTLLSVVLEKTELNIGAQSAIKNLTYYGLIVIAVTIALNIADIPLTGFAFLGGAVAIGLGLGTQNLLNNFISGIIVQTERPIKVGDTLEIDGKIGTVMEIGLRSTKIVNSSNSHIIFPNSFFLDKSFINWTLLDKKVRSKIMITLDHSNDHHRVITQFNEMLNSCDFILKDPAAKVYLENFSENGVDYSVNFWYLLPESGTKTETESLVRIKLLDLVKDKNIMIASPIRKIID